ncbi:DUF5610 domain-containing protein [Glaciecola sp. SC05]|uniref:DUF5610 domain-containing protein n=1 Tax=Glaciecola sp. SC05 TaxID=1987355 RepID=UPI00352778DB
MNTLEIKAAFPDVSGKRVANVFEFKDQQGITRERSAGASDTYRSANASDAVAAKVLSFSIGQRFEGSLALKNIDASQKQNKLQVIDGSAVFNIDKVVDNVLGFVNAALTELSKNGANSDDIAYFKQQAVDGVNYGVDQAKEELANVSDEKLSKSIEDSRTRIIVGIDSMPVEPAKYLKSVKETANDALNDFTIRTNSGKPIDISFGPKAFLNDPSDKFQKQMFTTQASNLSFSVMGELNSDEAIAFADLANRVDDLANTFYRKNMEGVYSKAVGLGYDDSGLLNLSMQRNVADKKSLTNAYENIKHLNENSKLEDLASPKAVAEYIARLMNVMETSERELASEQDYNQVINGLVNQMKDVQVPDLLQAINRFHAFNSKFVTVE